MIKPLWAVAGVALLGTVGIAGALVVASSGGEEEIVQQMETATPTPGGAKGPRYTPTGTPSTQETPAGCDPNPPPPPGTKLWRWGDLTVHIPESGIRVLGIPEQEGGPSLEISPLADPDHGIEIDARTGAVAIRVDDDAQADNEAEVNGVANAIKICPIDRSRAPWPYTGDPPATMPISLGKVRYVEPDPASGIQVLIGGECANGCRDAVAVRSAHSTMDIDVETGEMWPSSNIAPGEREAFERYLASVQIQEPR